MFPEALILHILTINRNAVSTATARQITRSLHHDATNQTQRLINEVSAYDPELPLWLLQQLWPSTHPFFKAKLLEARCVQQHCRERTTV